MVQHFSEVAKRYAKALFSLAQESGTVDTVDADLKKLEAMLLENNALSQCIKSPVHNKNEKSNIIGKIAQGATFHKTTCNFLHVVGTNGRLDIVEEMIAAFFSMVAESRDEITAEVISATPLGKKHVDALTKKLESALKKKVFIQPSIQPEILGGLIVKVGSVMLDNSLANELKNVHDALRRVTAI